MSLARAWGRELLGASSAALIVPSAMVAAVVALALGGAFDQVGALGQLFAGPSLPGVENGSTAGSHPGLHGFAPAPPSQPSPPPAQPTPVGTVVKAVTSVTRQLPAPTGPIASQTIQAAGTAVDNLLPETGQP